MKIKQGRHRVWMDDYEVHGDGYITCVIDCLSVVLQKNSNGKRVCSISFSGDALDFDRSFHEDDKNITDITRGIENVDMSTLDDRKFIEVSYLNYLDWFINYWLVETIVDFEKFARKKYFNYVNQRIIEEKLKENE